MKGGIASAMHSVAKEKILLVPHLPTFLTNLQILFQLWLLSLFLVSVLNARQALALTLRRIGSQPEKSQFALRARVF